MNATSKFKIYVLIGRYAGVPNTPHEDDQIHLVVIRCFMILVVRTKKQKILIPGESFSTHRDEHYEHHHVRNIVFAGYFIRAHKYIVYCKDHSILYVAIPFRKPHKEFPDDLLSVRVFDALHELR